MESAPRAGGGVCIGAVAVAPPRQRLAWRHFVDAISVADGLVSLAVLLPRLLLVAHLCSRGALLWRGLRRARHARGGLLAGGAHARRGSGAAAGGRSPAARGATAAAGG